MRISTRVQYGVRLMLALAYNHTRGYVNLTEIARAEGVSEKYLSLIVIPLKGAGLISSARGMKGGYILARDPSQITIKEIFSVLEGDSCIIDCVRDKNVCDRAPICGSREVWSLLEERISETLNSVNLEHLVRICEQKAGRTLSYSI
jgi:Rrf2 family protein